MIIGNGTDIIEKERIDDVLGRHPERFVEKFLTEAEQKIASSRADSTSFIAGRWASKEAVAKALGTGFGEQCRWLDIEVLNDDLGKPVVTVKDKTRETTESLGIRQFHLSISHERHMACAFVIAEG